MIRIRNMLLDILFGTLKKDAFNHEKNECAKDLDLQTVVSDMILGLKTIDVITDTGVHYEKIRESDIYQTLQNTVYPCLAAFDLNSLETEAQKKAFWINIYHLITIDAVLQFSVNKSVTEGWFGIIRFFRRAAYMIGGMRFSLEDIEHGILRANRGVPYLPGKHYKRNDPRLQYALQTVDARIHFALNCASRSCAPIAYYSADRIDAQLDLAAANHIHNTTKMDKSGVALRITKLFKWYQKDFGGHAGILEMIHSYLPENDMRRKLIENFDLQTMVIFDGYDWRLNVLA